MDGEVIINTRLNTDDLEKDLRKAESDLKKYEKEMLKLTDKKAELEVKVKAETSEYEKQIADLKARYNDELSFLKSAGDGNIPQTTQARIDEKYQAELDGINQKYRVQSAELDKINSKLNENYKKQSELKGKVSEVNDELRKRSQFTDIKNSIDDVGKGVKNIVGDVVRWGLYLFSIRSAYSLISSAVSTLSSYNAQIGTDIAYIRFALASTLQPVIEGLIKLVYKLLVYTAYVAKAWFGVNLFANGSTKAFEKTNKAVKATGKNAKELQKTLAGFDEMNVLQENGDVSSGGGTGVGDIKAPSIDLSEWDKIKIPKWLEELVKRKDEIIAALAGIGGAATLMALGFSPLQALGGGLAIMGIVYAIEKLMDYLKNPTFENFVGILEGIALAVAGVAIAFGAWPVAIGAAIAFGIALIIQHFDAIKDFFRGLITWMDENFLGLLRTLFGPLGDVLYAPFKFFFELAFGAFNAFYGGIKQVVEGIMKIFQGDFIGGIKEVAIGFFNILTAPLQGIFNAFKDLFTKLLGAASDAWNGIKGVFSTVVSFFKNIFTNAWTAVKNVFSVGGKIFDGIKEGIVSAFKAIVNAIIGGINKIVAIPFNKINSVLSAIKNVNIVGFKPFKGLIHTIPVPQIPKLARGGIVNNPGAGVMMGNYIAGEKGAEAVIPLNDETLDRLGLAFARHTNINATVPVYVGNRQIAREIKRINAENDFAYNR